MSANTKAPSEPTEFILFWLQTHNTREDKRQYYYLQWNGNEAELRMLEASICRYMFCGLSQSGDEYVSGGMGSLGSRRISEDAALQHESACEDFEICRGRFRCPDELRPDRITEEHKEAMPSVVGSAWDGAFWKFKMPEYWTEA
jgi:hypothetical protein